MKWLSVFFVMVIGSAIAIDDPWTDEKIDQIFAEATEVTIPVPEMVARNNYSIEVHHVMTKDGYILEIHRVPASPISPAAKGKPVIFLMHGILSSSADWIEMGPGRSFGYILADAGYDVWIGNARGNTYSRRHNTIATQKEFWNFSWHEIGIYDLPAMIDFALATTGQKKLFYIGHSQGTTTFFVLMSQRPSYNDKINAMFALAPVAYMGNLKSPALRLAALSTNSLTELYGLFGLYVWEPSPRWLRAVRATYCEKDTASQLLCTNSILLLSGFNKDHLNMSMLPIIYGHSPAGSAVRQLSHYGQEIQSHKFRQYDYGIVQNLLVYGSLTPPPYDMSLVTAPVHLVYSENDYLAAPVDVAQLYNELGNPVELWRIPDKNWAHVDYIWGIDSPSVVYFPIIEKIKKIYGAQTYVCRLRSEMVQGAPFTLTIFALGAMKLLIISLVGFISSSAAGRNDRIWAAGIVDKLLSGLTTDVSETVPQMIAANHYNVEIHHVTTEDGYILEMHRIPASPTRPAAHGKPVVFLMHGLLSSSADWVLVGPGKSFSYILTDLGYDVWMGNARGNTYSRNHTTLSPSSSKFWQFSFHEIGIYDLPIMIDYVLKTTGLKKIIYVGHSQGTTSFYVMASEKTEYNAKIKAMFSLAPVAYTNHLFSPIFRLIATFVNNSLEFFTRFGVNEILPRNRLLSVVGATLCNDNGISHVLCVNGMFIMYGFNTAQLNTTLLPIIARHTPAGGSIRQVAHYGQGIESGKFRQYDYDYMENKLKYGSSMPPDYNLRLVTAPVHLTYSVNDWISSPTDVVRLYNELGNPIEMVKVDDDKWNHLDYYWGINAKEFVYDPILATLNARYSD